MTTPPTLFDELTRPEGFRYEEELLDTDEEHALLDHIRSLDFQEVKMRGVVAKRRVVQYGWKYSFESFKTTEGPPLPEFLLPLRDRAARFASLPPEQLSEALITEYSPGAAIGWHRDAPGFGVVVGISLLTPCRFRFRRTASAKGSGASRPAGSATGRGGAWETTEHRLEPRSVYALTGAARSEWQHSIPAVNDWRYSITFRTLKRPS